MVLPVGVLKANLTFGVPLDDTGEPIAGGKVTILAAIDRVWAATGDLILAHNVTVQLDGAKVVPFAATDQPGMVDAAGNPVTDWTLDAVVDVPGRARQLLTFALPTGGVDGLVVDFDRLVPVEQSDGQVVAISAVVSVNGKPGPAPVLAAVDVGAVPAGTTYTAADVGALPSNAPATLKNPTANATPFLLRNAADTATAFSLSAGGTVVAAGSLTTTTNDVNALLASGASAGVRFGPTAGQTFIQRTAATVLLTDSYFRFKAVATASRMAAASAGVGAGYFDTTLGKPVWSDGTAWRDAAGTIV